MPIYEYHCLHCQKNFEKLILTRNHEAIACPHCHSHQVEKQLSLFSMSSSRANEPMAQARSSSSHSCASCSSGNCSTCR